MVGGDQEGDGALHPFLRDERLRKDERLLKRGEFLAAQRGGARHVTPLLVVYACPAPPRPYSRLGVTVSRKVGNAVVRNVVKRRLRETFRRNKASLPVGFEFVWIARAGAGEAPWEALRDQALQASQRAARRARQPRQGASSEGRAGSEPGDGHRRDPRR